MVSLQNSSPLKFPKKDKNQVTPQADNSSLLPPVTSEDFLPKVSRWTTFSGLFLAVMVITASGFAYFSKYKVTVKANATVRPAGELRLVQPEIEGTIKSIHVKDNQLVKQGDIIAVLDSEQLQIKKSQLQGNIQQTNLQLVQIEAQIKSIETQILAESRVIERTIISAKADLEKNQREHQERQTTTFNESLAAASTLQKSEADLQKAEADLAFAKSDVARYQQLVKSGAIARREFDQKRLSFELAQATVASERKSVEVSKAKQKSAAASVNPSSASVSIAQERIAQETAKGEATIAVLNKEKQALIQRQAEINSQLKQSEKELQQTENQLQKNTIRATNDGTILKLNLRNPGQVVRASDAVAEIAPSNAPLIIKANVLPGEIKTVAVNQKVQLRVDACPYPDYGTLIGTVKAVSPDAITQQTNNSSANQTSGSSTFFETIIQPENLTFGRGERQCHLQPGMEAKADIISREETVLRFMLRKARLLTDI
jgi:HlyD family secretion protein